VVAPPARTPMEEAAEAATAERKRRYKEGVEPDQAMLLPPRVEDYVAENDPVRAIKAYVGVLDLAALAAIPGICGISTSNQLI